MQVNILRHLPTEWNTLGKLQGRRDIPIAPVTREVQRQIAKNQRSLSRLGPFSKVLASTLQRTVQTAEHYGYHPTIDPLLDELDFGPFEGRQKTILFETFGDRWTSNPKEIQLGESLSDLKQRIKLCLEKYNNQKNVLIFGHGAWARALISYYNTGDINEMNKISFDNNEFITLNFNHRTLGIF